MLLNLYIMFKIIPNNLKQKSKTDYLINSNYLFKILWFILAQKLNTRLL